MLEYINRLRLDDDLKSRLTLFADNNVDIVLSLAEKCNNGNFSCLKGKDDMLCLAVIVECISHTKKLYQEKGIPEDILFDTLDDIRIWCENNQNKGLSNYNWLKNHMSCELFKIGRLQFQLFHCRNLTLRYSRLPFKYGDRLIYVHIPQGEKLIYGDCVNSLLSAVDFFNKYFPEYDYRYFFCESWLLYEENWQFMDVSSNILQFSSLFDIAYSVKDDSQAIERIFSEKERNIKNYPQKTTLQKNALAFLQSGGKLGVGVGYIDKENLV